MRQTVGPRSKGKTHTPSLQECGTRLSATRVPLHAPRQRLDHALLAVVSPSKSIELLGVENRATDGEATTFEGCPKIIEIITLIPLLETTH